MDSRTKLETLPVYEQIDLRRSFVQGEPEYIAALQERHKAAGNTDCLFCGQNGGRVRSYGWRYSPVTYVYYHSTLCMYTCAMEALRA